MREFWLRARVSLNRYLGYSKVREAGKAQFARCFQFPVLSGDGDCVASSSTEIMTSRENVQDLGLSPTREPVMLALLSALAVVLFLAVGGLSRMYQAQRESLGNRWFTRGAADLKDRRFDRAVDEFRTALLYSRDNYTYQLDLAEALVDLKRTDEAYAYLINLWEREPENGLVNLELARIAAHKGQTEPALRYYHNAIYSIWPGDQEAERRDARLELIEFLLGINGKAQAQAELIALAASLDDDVSMHERVGGLFLQVQDYEHALGEYRVALKMDGNDPSALAGAGLAAFELGRYDVARSYLEAAVSENPGDTQSAARLKTTELVLTLDPFRRQISVNQRDGIAIEVFAAAGERIKACPGVGDSSSASSGTSQPTLAERWAKMKPQMTEQGLRGNSDLVDEAMNLTFEIERQANAACGAPTGIDLALLLISKLHEVN
jgi:tetratricopeptide (TPR) repeat protein